MGKFSSQHAALGGKKGNFPSKILYFLNTKSPHQKYEIRKLKERKALKKRKEEEEAAFAFALVGLEIKEKA